MIDISNGRYWDLPWSLVSGCTPCSPGCDHCWSAAIEHRVGAKIIEGVVGAGDWDTLNGCIMRIPSPLTNGDRKFNGEIITHPERLSIPLKRRKPTVYSIWNDWAHENATHHFRSLIVKVARECPRHTILALTKRPAVALDFWNRYEQDEPPDNWWHGLTICNQAEADEKIPIFLKVPGKKFLSIEPMLSEMNIRRYLEDDCDCGLCNLCHGKPSDRRMIAAVILGGETGPGARPLHPDWVRSIKDQCAVAGVPFFFKQWGEAIHTSNPLLDAIYPHRDGGDAVYRVRKAGRLLDGRTHDDLPWRAE